MVSKAADRSRRQRHDNFIRLVLKCYGFDTLYKYFIGIDIYVEPKPINPFPARS